MRTRSKDTINKIGEEVTVMGWVGARRDHGKLIFLDIRDRWEIVQVVCNTKNESLLKEAEQVRPEWVISVTGKVKDRPKGMENPELATGKIEIEASELAILSEAKTPPFALDNDGYDIGEEHRLKYRYLDIRRPRLLKNLLMRDKIIFFLREYLRARDFAEIETPIITKSTPEGARDYVVPSRIYPGKFYALPQSPQQYKQLLMVGGIERYFQIARCFRDEDTRGDRQPEFTQLDIEMSFVEEEDVLSLTEELFTSLAKKLFPEKHLTFSPFPRISYKEAMEKYKSDKPDLRKDKNDPSELAFAFVVNFPMFEWRENEKRWDAVHHPFTKVKIQDSKFKIQKDIVTYLRDNAKELVAHQYDLVLNGYEIGGGSIREHNPKILEAVFEVMGHSKESVRTKFGHLLEAFGYGVPPHGGIAAGIDRLTMIFANEPSVREVIAFPKTGDARDLMMDSPSELDEHQLKELGISISKPK